VDEKGGPVRLFQKQSAAAGSTEKGFAREKAGGVSRQGPKPVDLFGYPE